MFGFRGTCFRHYLIKFYIVGTHSNPCTATIRMLTYNIGFHEILSKHIILLLSNSRIIPSQNLYVLS